jgi:hypothetical protein
MLAWVLHGHAHGPAGRIGWLRNAQHSLSTAVFSLAALTVSGARFRMGSSWEATCALLLLSRGTQLPLESLRITRR